MIYLDCAATSLQKPKTVPRAMARAVQTMASPGRGGHAVSMRAAETVYRCREEIAAMFNVPFPEQVVFTMNATHALNIAIFDCISSGDKVVVSGYEHNSVMRPLRHIGARVEVVRSGLFDNTALLDGFRRAIPGAKAVICTAMSNVFGYILPLSEISALCHSFGVPLIVDASQAAGSIPVNFRKLEAVYIAMPGHKSLLGPQGTGVLLCGKTPRPLLMGGTGSESKQLEMPVFLPDATEAGTHNVPGIAGLLAGVTYVRQVGMERILQHEKMLMNRFLHAAKNIDGLELFAAPSTEQQGAVLSVRHNRIDCEAVSAELAAAGICVRSGIHCAPFAHETAGTYETGTIRFSFSPFNTIGEINTAVQVLKNTVNKRKT